MSKISPAPDALRPPSDAEPLPEELVEHLVRVITEAPERRRSLTGSAIPPALDALRPPRNAVRVIIGGRSSDAEHLPPDVADHLVTIETPERRLRVLAGSADERDRIVADLREHVLPCDGFHPLELLDIASRPLVSVNRGAAAVPDLPPTC